MKQRVFIVGIAELAAAWPLVACAATGAIGPDRTPRPRARCPSALRRIREGHQASRQ